LPEEIEEISLNVRQCQRMADCSRDDQDKRSWQALADKWRQMLAKLTPR